MLLANLFPGWKVYPRVAHEDKTPDPLIFYQGQRNTFLSNEQHQVLKEIHLRKIQQINFAHLTTL